MDSTYQVLLFSPRNDKVRKTAQTPELEIRRSEQRCESGEMKVLAQYVVFGAACVLSVQFVVVSDAQL
ncbi:MAG TPA: hypothetical protein VF845_00005, partial [Terriglobales bacterium]